jgi:hypothetical protein
MPRGQTTVAEAEKPDPNADYWTLQDIAAYWGVEYESVRRYRNRPGKLPPQDETFGRSPVWRPATVIGWQRPRQGARTDLQKEADDA